MSTGPEIEGYIAVSVSRLKHKTFAFLLLFMLLSFIFTIHIFLYDSSTGYQTTSFLSDNKVTVLTKISNSKILHLNRPAPAPYKHIRFPKTTRKLPQCLIIGVRKCGTRALLEMLNLHPKIQKASGEIHFFDRDENYLKGLKWYRKKMPLSFQGQITIEKSPSYFVTPEVPERIRAMNSSIKLLLIIREPVVRAISDYTQLRSHAATAVLPSADIHIQTQTLQQSPPINTNRTFEDLSISPNGSVVSSYRPLVLSTYHQFILRWLEVFPRNQILIVNGDQLIDDPLSQIRKIEDFLGIGRRINQHNFYFNETKGFYCLKTDMGENKCLRETKGRKHPDVNPKVISKLRKFFVEHNQRFYDLVGEDFGWPEE